MADFGTFDLARAYAGAEEVKAAQQMSTLRGLQTEAAKLELEKAKQPKKMTFDDLLSNTQIANAAYSAVAQNPASAPYWQDVMTKAGLMSPDADLSKHTPQELQQIAAQRAKETGLTLAALDKEKFGPDYSPEMKAFVESGGNPTDVAAFTTFKDAEQARKDKAQLSGQAVTQRGQDISAATARRGQDITARGQDIADENADATRAITAATAAAGGKPTEGNLNSANYLGRMQAAEQKLGTYKPTTKDFIAANLLMTGSTPTAILANSQMTPEARSYYAAAADWVRAKLRKESGATIPEDEMAKEIKTYFPMPRDDDALIQQKAQARAQAEAGMQVMAGPSKPVIAEPVGQVAPASAQFDYVPGQGLVKR